MLIVKIGGGESINLDGIARDLSGVEGPFVIVHGANALRDELARRLGVESVFSSRFRATPACIPTTT